MNEKEIREEIWNKIKQMYNLNDPLGQKYNDFAVIYALTFELSKKYFINKCKQEKLNDLS